MLDRLVCRSVLPVTHGIVREYEDARYFHQGCKPYGRACVIAEDEEGGAIGPDFGQREPIESGAHRVLANTEVEVLPSAVAGLKMSSPLISQKSFVRRTEVRRSAEKP